MERYAKQILFDGIRKEGQEKLLEGKVVIIGCGALGTVIANNLVRAGVGYIRLVDRDYIEMSNLQRQLLYDEEDIKNNLPKVIAAENKLKKINSSIRIESIITDVNSKNAAAVCEGMDVILDATDNFNTRFLINDVSVKLGIPWIYGGAIGSTGMIHTIIPGKTPCFRCIFPDIPPAGAADTCDTVGVLNSITNIIASLQSTEALKLLTGNMEEIIKEIRYLDIWQNVHENISMSKKESCKTCGKNDFEYLNNDSEDAIYLCGKDSVQVNPMNQSISVNQIIERLNGLDIAVRKNPYYLKFTYEDVQFTLFYDGRAILKNIADVTKARSLYARIIGL
ncbi:MAG: ThiF family adenylyltransferase [Bacillota bacterium]